MFIPICACVCKNQQLDCIKLFGVPMFWVNLEPSTIIREGAKMLA
jgi:hypothetical protein